MNVTRCRGMQIAARRIGSTRSISTFAGRLSEGQTILDRGCGGGAPVAAHMATLGLRVTGIDGSPTLVSICRGRMPDQEWIVGDMRSLALGRTFDGLLAWDSFFH